MTKRPRGRESLECERLKRGGDDGRTCPTATLVVKVEAVASSRSAAFLVSKAALAPRQLLLTIMIRN